MSITFLKYHWEWSSAFETFSKRGQQYRDFWFKRQLSPAFSPRLCHKFPSQRCVLLKHLENRKWNDSKDEFVGRVPANEGFNKRIRIVCLNVYFWNMQCRYKLKVLLYISNRNFRHIFSYIFQSPEPITRVKLFKPTPSRHPLSKLSQNILIDVLIKTFHRFCSKLFIV